MHLLTQIIDPKESQTSPLHRKSASTQSKSKRSEDFFDSQHVQPAQLHFLIWKDYVAERLFRERRN